MWLHGKQGWLISFRPLSVFHHNTSQYRFILSFFHLPGSQDIRNIIPFSGNGFVLGGRSQVNKPVNKALPSSSNTLFPPSSQTPPKTPSSHSVLSALNGRTNPNSLPSARPAGLTGPNAPTKRSISNTKVFVNINGSPVRIHKPTSQSGSIQEMKTVKQRSIDDLLRKPASSVSTSNRQNNTPTSTSTLVSPPRATQPCGGATGSPANASQASKKRLLDNSRGSTIYDFFHKASGSGLSPSSSSSATSSSFTSSLTASSTSTSSASSSALMVSCPVCQVRVQESKVNEHLDSCLRWVQDQWEICTLRSKGRGLLAVCTFQKEGGAWSRDSETESLFYSLDFYLNVRPPAQAIF